MTKYDGDEAAQVHRHLHSHLPTNPALRVKALESLVVERGIVAPETLDGVVTLTSKRWKASGMVVSGFSDGRIPSFKCL